MANVDFDDDDYINTAGMGPRLLPVQATELLGGIGSQFLRSLLVAAPGDIPEEFACSPEDAALALACCDLAELAAWDKAALLDAATVGGNEEERVMWGLESRDRLARRISLAMKAEKAPEVMSPAAGVLLLRRAGLNVFHQLLDAVAWLQLDSDATLPNFRLLKGIAEPQPQAGVNEAGDAPEPKEQRQDRRLKMCDDAGLKMDKRALRRMPNGVGNVAALEGVARQTFTGDVKAALERREAAIRDGSTIRRA